MSGIFISKGMSVSIPVGGLSLSLNPDGKSDMTVKVQVVFDVCPSWLDIALEHLQAAKICNATRTEAWKGEDNETKGRSLEREFTASMQAIVAAAIAIDSFYATIQKKVKVGESLIAIWREKKTPRYSQISETLRIAFQLKPKGLKVLRAHLKQIYQFRDQAVHPSSKPNEAILHPELKVGVEWRFVAFRYENALPLVQNAIEIIGQLVATGKPKNSEVQKYADFLKSQLSSFRTADIFGAYSTATAGEIIQPLG